MPDGLQCPMVSAILRHMERPQIVSEMRDLSTKNSAEIRDAVEDGKRRIAKLVTEGKALGVAH